MCTASAASAIAASRLVAEKISTISNADRGVFLLETVCIVFAALSNIGLTRPLSERSARLRRELAPPRSGVKNVLAGKRAQAPVSARGRLLT